MSRQQSRYALPNDGGVKAALEASDDEYFGDDNDDEDRSCFSGSTRSSANSSSTASAGSLDRYADRASSAKTSQGKNRDRQMKKNRRRRRGERQRYKGNGNQGSRGAADRPVAHKSAAVRKAAAKPTPGGRGEGQKQGSPQPVHRDTRYDVPSHKKRRKRPHKRKEKHPTSAAGTVGTAPGGAAAAASTPDKYSVADLDCLHDHLDGQIEITLSPSDSYGVEVHESRNVSSRGYAFAKPLDKRYMGKSDGENADSIEEDSARKISGYIKDEDRATLKSSRSSVQAATFSLNFPALQSKPLSSALAENAGTHRMPLQTSVTGIPYGGKELGTIYANDLLLSMPVCDELSALHKEAYLMEQEVRAIKKDRLLREIEWIKMYKRHMGRESVVVNDLDEDSGGLEQLASEIFQDEDWDADALLASYAKGKKHRKGKWKIRHHADDRESTDRMIITKLQKRQLQRKRGNSLTVLLSDERVRKAFKAEFADIVNAIEESDVGGPSITLPSSDARVRNVTDKYSAMAISPDASPQKVFGKSNATLTSTASKLITIVGCRALRSINFSSVSRVQSGLAFWYISDDDSASCVGLPPPKLAERLSRDRNLSGDGSYPASNVHYMASGPLGSYFVRFASGETWWGLGGNSPSHHEQFTLMLSKIDVRRIAFGPPHSVFSSNGTSALTVVPWVVLGNDGTVAWSSSLPPSLERLLSDRPRDSAAPVEVSLGAGNSFFVKFADGDFQCVVSSPLANVCRQIKAKGARITNMVLHAESYDYIIRHSNFRKA